MKSSQNPYKVFFMQYKYIDIKSYPHLFEESMQIYRDLFDAWEREDERNILKNIKLDNYKMIASLYKDEIVGFYILDKNIKLHYTLFSFLAVKKFYQGKGIGTQLTLHAIEYFSHTFQQNWLLIEAEERQSKLYSKLGFKDIKLDYKVPSFESQGSIDMHLMLLQKEVPLTQNMLMKIIEDIFYRGYALKKDDVRITQQLKRVEESKSLFCYTHTHETIH